MDSTSDQNSDPFADLLTLEDTYFTEGYNLGLRDGTRAGLVEGRLFGLEKGFSKAVGMGRMHGQARVWGARLSRSTSAADGMRALKGGERLKRHVERLTELTDPESLECKNGDDDVNEFDERLAGAKAKLTLVERIAGEADGGDSKGTTTSPSPSRSPRPATATSQSVVEGQEIEITSTPFRASRPQRSATDGRQIGELDGSTKAASNAAAARRAAPEF